jgi:hypothetical protein
MLAQCICAFKNKHRLVGLPAQICTLKLFFFSFLKWANDVLCIFFFKKKIAGDALSVAQNLTTTNVARKSSYAIFYPKIRFSTSLHLKTHEKHF